MSVDQWLTVAIIVISNALREKINAIIYYRRQS